MAVVSDNKKSTLMNQWQRDQYQGKTFVDVYGDKFFVIQYLNWGHSTVIYESGLIVEGVCAHELRCGKIRASSHPALKDRPVLYDDMRNHLDVWNQYNKGEVKKIPDNFMNELSRLKYLGKTFVDIYGDKFTVIEYINSSSITVRYESGEIRRGINTNHIKSGKIRSKGDRSTKERIPLYGDMRDHPEIWNQGNPPLAKWGDSIESIGDYASRFSAEENEKFKNLFELGFLEQEKIQSNHEDRFPPKEEK